ncbi:DNA adenine methylase [Gordonia terrae]
MRSKQVASSETATGLKVPGATAPPAPFLRWAGSKRWLLGVLPDFVPRKYAAYYEPFLGSGAVYLRFGNRRDAFLSDANIDLVRTFQLVRDQHETIAEIASAWEVDRESYYKVRSFEYEAGSPEAAAQFIYLNRLCFNGLYRVNSNGKFNVPYGRPRPTNVVVDPTNLRMVAEQLSQVRIDCLDFEKALLDVRQGDFVYLDPPYVDKSPDRVFSNYTIPSFTWNDQERLCGTFTRLSKLGVSVILSNKNTPEIKELYNDFRIVDTSRHSSISGNAKHRRRAEELLILSDSIDPNLDKD